MIIRMHAYLYKFYNTFGNFLACIQDSVHTHPPLPNILNAGYHPDNLKAKDLPLSLSNWQFSREFSTRTETAACSNLKKFVLSNAVNDVISFDQMSPLGGQLTIKASKLRILPGDIHLIRTISTRTYTVTSNLTYTKQVLSRNFFFSIEPA